MTWDELLAKERERYESRGVIIREMSPAKFQQYNRRLGFICPDFNDEGNLRIHVRLNQADMAHMKMMALYHELGHAEFYLAHPEETRQWWSRHREKRPKSETDREFEIESEVQAFENQLEHCLTLRNAGFEHPHIVSLKDLAVRERQESSASPAPTEQADLAA